MKVVKVLEDYGNEVIAIVKYNGEVQIAQYDVFSGDILGLWKLSEEELQKYL